MNNKIELTAIKQSFFDYAYNQFFAFNNQFLEYLQSIVINQNKTKLGNMRLFANINVFFFEWKSCNHEKLAFMFMSIFPPCMKAIQSNDCANKEQVIR